MSIPRVGFILRFVLVVCVCASGLCAWAQPTAATGEAGDTAPPAERLVVRDVSVFVSDAFGGRLNHKGLFDSTLPRFASTRRKGESPADPTRATPVGLVTFEGETGALIDVLLEIDKGTFLGAWPKTPRRRNRLLWADLELQAALKSEPAMPDGHWLLPLRESSRLAPLSGRTADRFLLYDAEFDHPNDLKVVVSDGGYSVTYFGDSAVHDVTLYKPVEGGWVTGTVDVIQGKVEEPEDKAKSQEPEQAQGEQEPAETGEADEGEPAEVAVALSEAEAEVVAAVEAVEAVEAVQAAEELPMDAGHEHNSESGQGPGKDFTIKGENPHEGEYSISFTIDAVAPQPRLSIRETTIEQATEDIESGMNSAFTGFSYDTPPDPANPRNAYEQIAEFVLQQASIEGTAELIWDPVEEAPVWDDGDGVSVAVPMSDEVLDRDAVFASWESRLADQGMGDVEVAHVLGILRSVGLDDKQMTVVYRLDEADIAQMLPIEVTPAADRVSRAALVVLVNADPDLAGRVDELIAQLGDPSWARREEAHKQLLQIGQGAKRSLQSALGNRDMEIVYRVEQLLEAINNPSVSQ